jgi:hypothetical protein
VNVALGFGGLGYGSGEYWSLHFVRQMSDWILYPTAGGAWEGVLFSELRA